MTDRLLYTMSPEEKARFDFNDLDETGQPIGNQSTNPFDYSPDQGSDYQRYAWEMHELWATNFKHELRGSR